MPPLRAERELAEARACLERSPELAAERWRAANHWLHFVLNEVMLRQMEVLAGLACGELVPEHRDRICHPVSRTHNPSLAINVNHQEPLEP